MIQEKRTYAEIAKTLGRSKAAVASKIMSTRKENPQFHSDSTDSLNRKIIQGSAELKKKSSKQRGNLQQIDLDASD